MKRSVVLDANVLISAFINLEGTPALIYRAWLRGHFNLVISPYILEEVGSAFEEKLGFTPGEILHVMEKFYQFARVVEHEEVIVDKVEENDWPIFGTALAGNAEYIVSGDAQVLAVRAYRGICIITPRKFLESL